MILLAYRHGFRVTELCALRWSQVDLEAGFLHVKRLKRGIPSVHCIARTAGLAEVTAGVSSVSLSVCDGTGQPHDSGGVSEAAESAWQTFRFSLPSSSSYAAT